MLEDNWVTKQGKLCFLTGRLIWVLSVGSVFITPGHVLFLMQAVPVQHRVKFCGRKPPFPVAVTRGPGLLLEEYVQTSLETQKTGIFLSLSLLFDLSLLLL